MWLSLLAVVLFSLFSPFPSFAIEEFTTNQDVTYTFDSVGNAQVVQDISLTNNISNIYAKEYSLELKDTAISNISAADSNGNILKNVSYQGTDTTINLQFTSPVLGQGQTNHFSVSYSINNLATQKGKIWEVSIPQHSSRTDNLTIVVKVPLSFGNLAYNSPSFSQHSINNSYQQYSFVFTSANNKILLAFGNSQIFTFQLNYYLINNLLDPTLQEIPLPPDTASQSVVFNRLSPLPLNIITDPDGNWLAQYQLSSGQTQTITATGQVKIYPKNDKSLPPSTLLTQPQEFWPVSDPQITAISAQLNNPHDIYNYVVSTLSYNYNRLNSPQRKGALLALQNPQDSLCTEFTDLFVTLARAKNIPAREIEGFAFTNNPKIKPINPNADILHAWPQYWDSTQQSWISIDPTWGKTTNGVDYFNDLDLNHLTLVIHGQNSQLPPPPGSYKNPSNQKSVNISFASNETPPQYLPLNLSLKFNRRGSVLTVRNPNPNSINNIKLDSPSFHWQQQLTSLPPYAFVTYDLPNLSFFRSLLPKNQKIDITTQFDHQIAPQTTSTSYPPHLFRLILTIAVLLAIISAGGIIITILHLKI